jgi:hypothetical protein
MQLIPDQLLHFCETGAPVVDQQSTAEGELLLPVLTEAQIAA